MSNMTREVGPNEPEVGALQFLFCFNKMTTGLPEVDRDIFIELTGVSRLTEYAAENKLDWLHEGIEGLVKSADSIYRQLIVQWMRSTVGMKPNEFSCIALRLHRGGASACFGYIYQHKGENIYTCFGPTFDSMDGEYRHHFFPWKQLEIMHHHWSEELKTMRQYLQNKLKSEFRITHETAPNGGPVRYSPNDAFIILTAVFVGLALWKGYNILPVHANPTLIDISGVNTDPFLIKYWETLSQSVLLDLSRYISRVFVDPPTPIKVRVEIGQKLVLITRKAAEQAGSLSHRVWRELNFYRRVSELVMNYICPSFSLFVGLIIIPGITDKMVDNGVQKARIAQSESIRQLSAEIEQLRSRTYKLDPISKKEIYVSAVMEGMSDAMQFPLDYAEEYLILAREGACIVMEHLGRTFGNLKSYLRMGEFGKLSGNMTTNIHSFTKCVFEYVYALYAMNYKLHLVHADLHLNNITLFIVSFTQYHTGIWDPTYVIYDVHGQLYIFTHYMFTSGIIDFSRSVSLNKRTDPRDLDDTRYRMLGIWESLVPDFFNEHRDKMRAAVFEYPELMFKLFSAVDTYKLSKFMIDYFNTELKVPSSFHALLNRVLDIAKNYLIQQPLLLFNHQPELVEALDWPNLAVIKNCFEAYRIELFKPPEDFRLADYYSIDNPVRYTNDKPGPIIKTTDADVDAALAELRKHYPSRADILHNMRRNKGKPDPGRDS